MNIPFSKQQAITKSSQGFHNIRCRRQKFTDSKQKQSILRLQIFKHKFSCLLNQKKKILNTIYTTDQSYETIVQRLYKQIHSIRFLNQNSQYSAYFLTQVWNLFFPVISELQKELQQQNQHEIQIKISNDIRQIINLYLVNLETLITREQTHNRICVLYLLTLIADNYYKKIYLEECFKILIADNGQVPINSWIPYRCCLQYCKFSKRSSQCLNISLRLINKLENRLKKYLHNCSSYLQLLEINHKGKMIQSLASEKEIENQTTIFQFERGGLSIYFIILYEFYMLLANQNERTSSCKIYQEKLALMKKTAMKLSEGFSKFQKYHRVNIYDNIIKLQSQQQKQTKMQIKIHRKLKNINKQRVGLSEPRKSCHEKPQNFDDRQYLHLRLKQNQFEQKQSQHNNKQVKQIARQDSRINQSKLYENDISNQFVNNFCAEKTAEVLCKDNYRESSISIHNKFNKVFHHRRRILRQTISKKNSLYKNNLQTVENMQINKINLRLTSQSIDLYKQNQKNSQKQNLILQQSKKQYSKTFDNNFPYRQKKVTQYDVDESNFIKKAIEKLTNELIDEIQNKITQQFMDNFRQEQQLLQFYTLNAVVETFEDILCNICMQEQVIQSKDNNGQQDQEQKLIMNEILEEIISQISSKLKDQQQIASKLEIEDVSDEQSLQECQMTLQFKIYDPLQTLIVSQSFSHTDAPQNKCQGIQQLSSRQQDIQRTKSKKSSGLSFQRSNSTIFSEQLKDYYPPEDSVSDISKLWQQIIKDELQMNQIESSVDNHRLIKIPISYTVSIKKGNNQLYCLRIKFSCYSQFIEPKYQEDSLTYTMEKLSIEEMDLITKNIQIVVGQLVKVEKTAENQNKFTNIELSINQMAQNQILELLDLF